MRISHWALLGPAILAVGCSSGYSSGVSGGKPVADLTDDEWMTACESYNDYVLANLPESKQERFNCYFSSVSVLRTPAECETAFTECMRNPPSVPLDVGPVGCGIPFIDSACQATVSEAEACITADSELALERIEALDCSVSGNVPAIGDLLEMLPVPTECSMLGSRCDSLANGFYAF